MATKIVFDIIILDIIKNEFYLMFFWIIVSTLGQPNQSFT